MDPRPALAGRRPVPCTLTFYFPSSSFHAFAHPSLLFFWCRLLWRHVYLQPSPLLIPPSVVSSARRIPVIITL